MRGVPWLVIDTPDMAEVVLLGESMLSSGTASVLPVLIWASLGMAFTAHTVLSSCHSHATRRVGRWDLQHLCQCSHEPAWGWHSLHQVVLSICSTPKRDRICRAYIMSQSYNKVAWKFGAVALPLDCSVRAWRMNCVMHQAGCACGLVLGAE